jgi:hypothetical protein
MNNKEIIATELDRALDWFKSKLDRNKLRIGGGMPRHEVLFRSDIMARYTAMIWTYVRWCYTAATGHWRAALGCWCAGCIGRFGLWRCHRDRIGPKGRICPVEHCEDFLNGESIDFTSMRVLNTWRDQIYAEMHWVGWTYYVPTPEEIMEEFRDL